MDVEREREREKEREKEIGTYVDLIFTRNLSNLTFPLFTTLSLSLSLFIYLSLYISLKAVVELF